MAENTENPQNSESNTEEKEMSLKEERVRKIAYMYYSRPDIRKAMFEFSKNRECVPRYFEGFGTRPDSFQYDSDILELAKKGATSFHCSEEIWRDPMEIATGMKDDEIKKLRTGWDLLIDIDCKYIEYSKKAALAIIKALKRNGISNIGIKFSGGKGFHILVPWKAFPPEMSGKNTCDMFPEWPRLICQYLKEQSREFLEKDLYSSEDSSVLSKLKKGIRCERCKNMSEKAELVLFNCPHCRTQMENVTMAFEKKRIIRCPNCQTAMNDSIRIPVYKCVNCNIDSRKSPENFNEGFEHVDVFEVLGLDVILVSPRHLFRMPYSLHEKTALVSTVLKPEDIIKFDMIRDADPLKIKPVNFIPDSKDAEAASLLRNAIEFKPIQKQESMKKEIETIAGKDGKQEPFKEKGDKKFNDIPLVNVTPDTYPPSITKILEGMKTDGRKRALFILLSFFNSLKFSQEEISRMIEEWNKKNYNPLIPGYIRAQISWYAKQKEKKLPPNFDKAYYKEIGVNPTQEELASKNPLSWVVKKVLSRNYYKNSRYKK